MKLPRNVSGPVRKHRLDVRAAPPSARRAAKGFAPHHAMTAEELLRELAL